MLDQDDDRNFAKINKALDSAEFLLSLKSVNEVLREYRDTLENYVVDAANGNISAAKIAREMRKDVIDFADRVYDEALAEVEGERSKIDEIAIRDWILSQTPHIFDFADSAVAVNKLTGDERTSARDAMLDRCDLWVDSLNTLAQNAEVNAKGDPVLVFDGDDGDESCETCDKYKGQKHKKSWWEERGLLARPNELFKCGRFNNCNHHFYYTNGELAID
jgi:hypothetical protein